MSWVLDSSTNEKEVAWRRDDGVVVAFARKGLGEPWSGEESPPEDIDTYAPARVEAPEYVSRPMTKLAFRERFTMQERAAIELAALDDTQAPMERRQLAAMLRANLRDYEVAVSIHIDHPELITGVTALETVGVIGKGRAHEILSAPITDSEAYNA